MEYTQEWRAQERASLADRLMHACIGVGCICVVGRGCGDGGYKPGAMEGTYRTARDPSM